MVGEPLRHGVSLARVRMTQSHPHVMDRASKILLMWNALATDRTTNTVPFGFWWLSHLMVNFIVIHQFYLDCR